MITLTENEVVTNMIHTALMDGLSPHNFSNNEATKWDKECMPEVLQHRLSSSWLSFQIKTFYELHELASRICEIQQQSTEENKG